MYIHAHLYLRCSVNNNNKQMSKKIKTFFYYSFKFSNRNLKSITNHNS